ncbi:MAG: hypothetical protein JWO72_1172 [Caulobacteraceae bacterium]|nr:hypothetical protein [Caulobacteraceae bacterium]
MIAAVLALSLAWGGSRPARACGPAPYAACADSRQLLASKDFQASLKRFAGNAQAAYSQRDRSIAKEVAERLAAPAGPSEDLGRGVRLFAGCRTNACPEKAAVMLDRSGVLAIGVLAYHSESNPMLEVIAQRSGPQTAARAAILRSWAAKAVADDAARLHVPLVLQGVKIRALREDVATAIPVKTCSRIQTLIHRCR